ncbi:MAG TPA: Uma2 family endonuclease [Tepidisphaeraceae bacterium]|jgi:Uma2 family endonuclease|nr:Uma2 family endonuclease [Tepidisphaeraceae bacterium]
MSVVMPMPLGRPKPPHWTGEAFDRATAAGVFDAHRVELIEGQLLEMPAMNEPHALAVQMGTYLLMKTFPPDRFTVRVQLPMALGESRPLPDFVILNGPPAQNFRNPATAMLVIEVSDTTLDYDQVDKGELYAMHGLPEYWIVNLGARCLEVRRKPQGVGHAGARYDQITIHAEGETAAPLGAADCKIAVGGLLG